MINDIFDLVCTEGNEYRMPFNKKLSLIDSVRKTSADSAGQSCLPMGERDGLNEITEEKIKG